MQGTLVARSGAELVGGGEKPLFRDDWKKISATQCTSQGTGEAVLSLSSDVTKWPPWKREAAANGGRGASWETEEMYVHAWVHWGTGGATWAGRLLRFRCRKGRHVERRGIWQEKWSENREGWQFGRDNPPGKYVDHKTLGIFSILTASNYNHAIKDPKKSLQMLISCLEIPGLKWPQDCTRWRVRGLEAQTQGKQTFQVGGGGAVCKSLLSSSSSSLSILFPATSLPRVEDFLAVPGCIRPHNLAWIPCLTAYVTTSQPG